MTPCNRTVSVVVPVLDEAACIVSTLETVLADEAVLECIVVDGGSTDGTPGLVAEMQSERVRISSAPAGRASQMNAGARSARGDALLFLHADTTMPEGFGRKIADATSRRRWGCFMHSFSPNNWRLALISFVHNLRCRIQGIAYGDQAMFIGRGEFAEAGGFPETGLEDIGLSRAALEKFGRPAIIRDPVATASRKFVQIGEFRALGHVVSILVRHSLGRPVGNDEFFRNYR